MLGQFLAPAVNRGVRNTQLAGHLRDGLAAGLGQSDCFLFEFSRVDSYTN